MNIKAIKGTEDILPEDMFFWYKLEQAAKKIFELYGYSEIRTPIFEATELFKRGIGDFTDIVQKEMYTFPDNKDRSLTLRPEATASIVRAYIEHSMFMKTPVNKLFYIGPMFRYERPQAGRKRQFHQIGVEAIGTVDPSIDAENIVMLVHLLKELGISETTLKINSAGCCSCKQKYIENLKEFLSAKKDNLCKDCNIRYDKNIMRVLDCKNENCIQEFEEIPAITDFLCTECKEHFDTVLSLLKQLNIEYVLDKNLVRGLDYYTKTIFEVCSDEIGAQDAIGAGGRYDNLIKQLGGNSTPAIGFALGMERILTIMKKNQTTEEKRLGVFFAGLGDKAFDKIIDYVDCLRKQGIKAQFDYEKRSLKAQMRYANKMLYKYLVIIGDNELIENKVEIKDLDSGDLENTELDNICNKIALLYS
jgi:histidyl-tRNA synthetase